MSNYEASRRVLRFIGKVVDIKLKKGRLDNLMIDDVFINAYKKPSIIYFTTQGGRGESGFVNFEEISHCKERAVELEAPINVPELKGAF